MAPRPQWVNDAMKVFADQPGARLTKAYDVTIQRYRNSHAKIEDSKMHILWCMGSKFCVEFQRCPLKFHTKFEPIPRKICILRGVNDFTTYDILEVWHLKSWWDAILHNCCRNLATSRNASYVSSSSEWPTFSKRHFKKNCSKWNRRVFWLKFHWWS